MNLEKSILDIEDYVIDLRRFFHENAELSWKEYMTSNKIQEELTNIGVDYIVIKETGVIAWIDGGQPGKSLGIRADIDALPIEEKTNLPFSSKNKGVMHACGHDVHTAILLGTLKILNEMKEQLKGKLVFIFQPAEEFIEDSGAKYLSENEIVKDLDRIIGLHVWGNIEAGKAALSVGPIMASADTFDIYIQGKSAHGATPNLSIDPIIAGTMLVNAFQTIVSRENSPLEPQVISITAFNSGNSKNTIPAIAHLEGTCRAFNNDLRKMHVNQIKRIIEGVALVSRTEIKFDYHEGTPATINSKEAAEFGIEVAKEVFGAGFIDDFPKLMGGEDFAKYLLNIPGCFMFLGGAGDNGNVSQHSEYFDIDESVLKKGVEYFTKYALKYLQ